MQGIVWKTLPWKQLQRNVFRLQKRIYRAKKRGDVRMVHNLQRLLLRSRSARCLAVRRVSQDNRGKKTGGVDKAGIVGRYKTGTYRGQAGFKTLMRPSKKAQKRHLAHLKQVIREYRGSSQGGLIGKLNPIIRGWTNYYKTCSTADILLKMSAQLYVKLRRWAAFRHPPKWPKWCYRRYWKRLDGLIRFTDGEHYLFQYEHTKIKRHIKVIGSKSPFDGDWLYWAERLQRHPLKPLRVIKLLKWQCGKCEAWGLPFSTEDVLEVHHINGNHFDNRYLNLSLLPGHCHHLPHASRC